MHGARSSRSFCEQVLALRGRALGEPLVDEHAQRRAADGGGERIAAERAAVVAGAKQRHDRAAREHGRHGIDAAAERLAEHEHVGIGAGLVVVREHLARAPQAGLNLVEHEQHVALAAKRARRGRDSPCGGTMMPASAWIGSTRNATVFGVIAARSAPRSPKSIEREARRERAEILAVLLLGREPDDRRRAPVKIVAADDDLGAVLRDAFRRDSPTCARA